jgi:predicted site-specific integrase-resolvase
MTYLTTRQVAARLGVDVATVSRWAGRGLLPYAVKVPGRTGAYLFDPGVIDVVTRHRQEANA